jgi:CheY-like chemotaxis protein
MDGRVRYGSRIPRARAGAGLTEINIKTGGRRGGVNFSRTKQHRVASNDFAWEPGAASGALELCLWLAGCVVLAARNPSINIAGLSFLLADPNPHSTAIIHSILRGFGASRVIEARTNRDALQILNEQKIDLMMVEPNLPKGGGLAFIRSIRQDPNSPCRTVPILVITGDTRTSMIKGSRDCGANMVIAKPLSPSSLYERLTWVAFHPRKFIETANYFGPDRRFKIEGFPSGKGRRAGDNEVEVKAEEGPTLSQDDIDSLLAQAR